MGRIRAGGGPALLELHTYRWREHCGPNYDNSLGYRTEQEFLDWRKHCPLERLQAQGLEDGSLNAAEVEGWTDEIQAEFAAALRFAKESAFPHADAMLPSVYADNKAASLRRLPYAA